jgi:serine/threonine-protein kinase HipA
VLATQAAAVELTDLPAIPRADVYKSGQLAAHLTRTAAGVVFAYDPAWIASGGGSIASTLPVTTTPVVTPGQGVPAFFANLLPEGRRLTVMQQGIKTVPNDSLSVLMGIGSDLIGDVQVVAAGTRPDKVQARVTLDELADIDFTQLVSPAAILSDRVGIPGVQDKVSASMRSLPVNYHSDSYILKLSSPEFAHVVPNEAFFMRAAALSDIPTADIQVLHDSQGHAGLLVHRFDRLPTSAGMQAFAVEDGCQVMGLPPSQKGQVSIEDLLERLVSLCTDQRDAAATLLRQASFAYLSANGDAHAKNWSVMTDAAGVVRPTPAYDLATTQPYNDNTLALPIAGRRDGNAAAHGSFIQLGVRLGLSPAEARDNIRAVCASADRWMPHLGELPFSKGQVHKLGRVIGNRMRMLESSVPTTVVSALDHQATTGRHNAAAGPKMSLR